MINNLSFRKPIIEPENSKINADIWPIVQTYYEKGDYANTVRSCINYIDSSVEKKYANADCTSYKIPHGSTYINIEITEEVFEVTAPFLNIDTAKKVPVLRQVSQLNFSPLTITNIELIDGQLYFKFSCKLNECEPYKIYDVLKEICINADNYDDEFIHKFGAKHIQMPNIIPYSAEQKEAAWNLVQLYIKEALQGYEQLEDKRLANYLFDILIITLLKIDYCCAPQGNLRVQLEKTISKLTSTDDYYQRMNSGKEFLLKLQAYNKESLGESLYSIDIFVPYKNRSTLENIRNTLKYAYETSEKEIKAEDYLGAIFTLQHHILYLLYNNTVELAITQLFVNAMIDASEKPVKEAASILFSAVQKLMNSDNFEVPNNDISSTKTEDGFFQKIFKMVKW